ncbi:hypothetical protein BSL78_21719 [Apostichopus japonicus]|uniref:Superoxide dismutase copper chaperone n=1 Tax=Stichopus japonicus TaxID=307972 RepID=A0A2G8K081_STIJA|nr:hypothetical protein BSL78_21719 [Apostichopus japonicus]
MEWGSARMQSIPGTPLHLPYRGYCSPKIARLCMRFAYAILPSTTVEFAVQMTCQSCVDAIKNSFKDIAGVQSLTVNLAQEQVIVESILTSFQIQEILEQTGRRAVLKGQGSKLQHLGAAVSVLEASAQVKGVVRMTQVDERKCIIEGTLDGLRPGSHGVAIHEFGDISDGCNSCGGHFNPFNSEHGGPSAIQRQCCTRIIDEQEYSLFMFTSFVSMSETSVISVLLKMVRARFRIENDQLKVWDVIGRSFVVHEREDDLGQGETPQSKIDGNSGPGLACGIIARSAGLFENNKRICAATGSVCGTSGTFHCWTRQTTAPFICPEQPLRTSLALTTAIVMFHW